jgi:hypothetical protein
MYLPDFRKGSFIGDDYQEEISSCVFVFTNFLCVSFTFLQRKVISTAERS